MHHLNSILNVNRRFCGLLWHVHSFQEGQMIRSYSRNQDSFSVGEMFSFWPQILNSYTAHTDLMQSAIISQLLHSLHDIQIGYRMLLNIICIFEAIWNIFQKDSYPDTLNVCIFTLLLICCFQWSSMEGKRIVDKTRTIPNNLTAEDTTTITGFELIQIFFLNSMAT